MNLDLVKIKFSDLRTMHCTLMLGLEFRLCCLCSMFHITHLPKVNTHELILKKRFCCCCWILENKQQQYFELGSEKKN